MNKKGKFLIGISLTVLLLGGGYGAYKVFDEPEAQVYTLENISGTEFTLDKSKVTIDNTSVKINNAYFIDGDIEGFITKERMGKTISESDKNKYRFIMLDVTYKNNGETEVEMPFIFEKDEDSMQFNVVEVFEHTIMDDYNYTFEEYEKLKLVDTKTMLRPQEERRGTVLVATKVNDDDNYSLVINNKELKMSLSDKEVTVPYKKIERTSNRTELYGELVTLGDLQTGERLETNASFKEIEGLNIKLSDAMYFPKMQEELMMDLLVLENAQSMNVQDSLLFLTTNITNVSANDGGHIGTFYLKDKNKNIISTALNYNTSNTNSFEKATDYNLLEYRGFYEKTEPLKLKDSVEGNLIFTIPDKLKSGTYYVTYKGIENESEAVEIPLNITIKDE